MQPTVSADYGALRLETRYNYEDYRSISGFVGWNLEFGETVKLAVTPMVGAVAGRTDGVVPALDLDLMWRRLELYAEAEYVIPFSGPRFFYNWSELSVWPTDWLRAGLVTQGTRIFQTSSADHDFQRGFHVGVAGSKVGATFYYLFGAGSDDRSFVASIDVLLGGR